VHDYQVGKPLTQLSCRDTTANPILYDVVADPSERFFVGGGFDAVSARYTSTMPAMKDEINYFLENMVMTGGEYFTHAYAKHNHMGGGEGFPNVTPPSPGLLN